MDTARWHKMQELFGQAIEADPKDRRALLERRCGDDRELLEELLSLLAADESGHSMLDGLAVQAVDISSEISYEGKNVGPYRIVEQIGSGGMGLVFIAERVKGQFDQRVALKLIKRGMDSEDILRRFRGERQILARLNHPNIAGLLDGGVTEDGQPYFTLEYIDGLPIDEYCDRHTLSIDARLRLFQVVCEAVQYAHRNLVVHRDLKPSNILVTPEGTVKLLDFGIAKVLGGDIDNSENRTLTRTGFRVMTPGYASPEQARGQTVTTSSDVYSLGVVLYELLSGRRPYSIQGYSQTELEKVICTSDPEKPSTVIERPGDETPGEGAEVTPISVSVARSTLPDRLRKRLAGDLDTICLMALRKEPERRYSSAGQLAEDIHRHLAGRPVMARPDTLRYRSRKFLSRNRLAVTAATVILIVVAGLVSFYTLRLATERDRARLEAQKATQVAHFLSGLFEAADPNESKGADVTARELLDAGAHRIEKELNGQPELQAAMLSVIGNTYLKVGLLENARDLLQQALEMHTAVNGPDSPETVDTWRQLGVVWDELGNVDSAVACYTKAYEIGTRTLGDEDPSLVTDINHMGVAFYVRGDFEKAKQFFERAIDLGDHIPGVDSLDLAHALNHLGRILYRQEQYDRAEPLLRRGLRIRLAQLGPDNVEVVASRGTLAAVLRRRGQYDEAAALLRESLSTLKRLMGENHHYVGGMVQSLAAVEADAGRYLVAESLFHRSISILQHTLPDSNVRLAYPYCGLGKLLTETGRAREAETYLREAVELRQSTLTDKHWLTAEAKELLGNCLIGLGRFPEAESELTAADTVLTAEYGPQHRLTRETRQNLAALYDAWGKSTLAGAYRQELDSLGPANPGAGTVDP
jgi:serine/threonine protein kinase/tetratricopeptide (TPR) repeat protein